MLHLLVLLGHGVNVVAELAYLSFNLEFKELILFTISTVRVQFKIYFIKLPVAKTTFMIQDFVLYILVKHLFERRFRNKAFFRHV